MKHIVHGAVINKKCLTMVNHFCFFQITLTEEVTLSPFLRNDITSKSKTVKDNPPFQKVVIRRD